MKLKKKAVIFNTAGSGFYSFPVCCEHDDET